MKLVPRRQTFTGREIHSFNPGQEPLQSCGPVCAIGIVIECLDDQAYTLGLTQRKGLLGFENAITVDSLCKLSHFVSPLSLAYCFATAAATPFSV
jgi:hypothetical protein